MPEYNESALKAAHRLRSLWDDACERFGEHNLRAIQAEIRAARGPAKVDARIQQRQP